MLSIAWRASRRTLLRRSALVALVPAARRLTPIAVARAQSTPTATTPALFVRQDPTLGPYFTDPHGHTLYHLTKDGQGQSTCTGGCAEHWPPLPATANLTLPAGVAGALTAISRPDGTRQLAYNGMALYHYDDDKQAGQMEGQGEAGVWFVLSPGEPFDAPPTHATTKVAAATPSADGKIAVTLKEFSVMASATNFKVGQPYTFIATNAGVMPHELVIELAGANDQVLEENGLEAEAENIAPGTSQTLRWTFDKPGAYQLACHVGDHYPRGMALTIHVMP
jgi:predicted lipoprotein with Yx(FWY)xxD motif/uncharacterized cupredoxin-like copper-binding protein